MKNEQLIHTEKSVVLELREIRDKLNLELMDVPIGKIKAYLTQKKTLHPAWYL